MWWCVPVIRATCEAIGRRTEVWGQPHAKKTWDPILNITKDRTAGTWLKWYSTCLGSVRPWVQYCKNQETWAFFLRFAEWIPVYFFLAWATFLKVKQDVYELTQEQNISSFMIIFTSFFSFRSPPPSNNVFSGICVYWFFSKQST
jgi:hypothetical protein